MEAFQDIIHDNARGNAALHDLVKNLSLADLRLPMPAGWTVAAVLAHLVFWDLRAITLIEKWEREGVGDSAMDTDVVNETTRRLCLAIPPANAASLCLEVADEIDRLIAGLSPDMVEAIQTRGRTVHLNRADHRRTHTAEIEQALRAAHQVVK